MKNSLNSFFVFVPAMFLAIVWASSGSVSVPYSSPTKGTESVFHQTKQSPFSSSPLLTANDSDTVVGPLKYPMHDESHGIPHTNDYNGGLYLSDPSNIKTDVTYDTDSNTYNVTQKMGNVNYRPPQLHDAGRIH